MRDTNGLKNNKLNKKTKKEDNNFFIDKRYIISISGLSIITSLCIYTGKGPFPFIGYTIVAFFLLYIFYRDLLRYKPIHIENEKTMLAIATLIIVTLLVGRLSEYLFMAMARGFEISYKEAHMFFLPIPSGAMLATLLFDFHTAIVFSFILSLLSGLWLEEPFLTLYFFIGSLVAAFSIIDAKKRSHIIKAGFAVAIVNLLIAVAYLISKDLLFHSVSFNIASFSFMAGFVVSAVVFLMLPVFEYAFGITTDISLVEFLDVDHPLMRAMMTNAPGTYHHSVIVANLVEAAAENIKVNKLLARIGAYYHDIGKVKMPYYFVENQTGESKHEHISPHMSRLVLISHTKDGAELARQYRLPQIIIDIIQQHHGDSLITFFYEKAKASGEDVKIEDYKYPGPKPRTKEAALVMMADAVEGASRVLTEPSPARLSSLVEKIVGRIIMEGQLDECDFTFREIREIKNSFIHTLTGIFHKRINYPGFRFDEEDIHKEYAEKKDKPNTI